MAIINSGASVSNLTSKYQWIKIPQRVVERVVLTALRYFLVLVVTSAYGQDVSNPAAIPIPDLHGSSSQLQKFIMDAYRAGEKNIKIPPGTYRQDGTSHESCLYLGGLKDCEIDATGVTLVITNLKTSGIELDNCSNVTLMGGTFMRNPVSFSQGKIEAIGADRQSVDIRITKGYPTNIDDPDYTHRDIDRFMGLFDAHTRDWVAGSGDIRYGKIDRLGPDLFRFHLLKALATDYPIAVGNLAAWRGYGHFSNVFLHNCQNLKIIGITVYGCGAFTIFERDGEGGNYYYGCTIARGPAPEGADKNDTPLFSSACDGYHSGTVRKGPTYENCYVEFNDDDAFAIGGGAALVTESNGDSITVGNVGKADYRVGDVVRLYDENGASAGDAKVVAITPLPQYVCPQTPPKDFQLFSRHVADKDLVFQKVELDHPIPARFSWIAVNSSTTGNGLVIRNCKVYHNRERGMLVKASNVLIENCIVDGPTVGGIVIQPEIGTWGEADFTRNTTIRNNTISHIGLSGSSHGALNISEWRNDRPVPLPGGHQEITVEGNTFEDDDGVNIILSSAQRVTFRNNHFINPMQKDIQTAHVKPTSDSLYWITQSKDVDIEGNEITNPGPYMKTPVWFSETAINVSQK